MSANLARCRVAQLNALSRLVLRVVFTPVGGVLVAGFSGDRIPTARFSSTNPLEEVTMNRVFQHLHECDCQRRRRRQRAFDRAAASLVAIAGDVIDIEAGPTICDPTGEPRLRFTLDVWIEPTSDLGNARQYLLDELTRELDRLQGAVERLECSLNEGGEA